MERWLIAEYESVFSEIVASLNPDNHAFCIEIASAPNTIRGYGHIKARNADAAKVGETELLAYLRSRHSTASAA
jgi:indolepyruvate ferredoxin oxidoreductase